MKRISRSPRIRILAGAVATAVLEAACGAPGDGSDQAAEPHEVVTQAVTGAYDWLQFNGDARHGGNNTLETQIAAANVSGLAKLFTIMLPRGIRADSTVSVLTNVSTSSGVHDLAFLLTAEGRIMALDAHTGATVWSQLNNPQNLPAGNPSGSGKDVQSTPAVDPNRNFVYAVGLDGLIHKYNVGSGVEVTGGGWPEVLSAKFTLERAAPALTIAAANGTNYLYMGIGGYGDGGDYQGHIVAINLATGAQKVFNAVCSDKTVHFVTGGTPDCTANSNPTQSGVWARSGVVYDSDTNKIYFATGNGLFSPSTHQWGDSIIALNPDGSGINGGPVDSYTPSVFANLQSADLDLGSSAPLILPKGTSKYPHLEVHVGKDSLLRMASLDNLSGKGGPGNVGGALFIMSLPTGGEVQNALASWVNPADGSVWVYAVAPTNGVGGNQNGISALKLTSDASGNPSLTTMWTIAGSGGSSPFVANNVVYYATSNNIRALNPTTGAVLWSSASIGPIHWEEPVVVNGILYIGDDTGHLNAFSLAAPPPAFPVQINFQPSTAAAFPGYLEDNGLVFADRGNGWKYGWSADISSTARQRNSTLSPDERYDTLVQPQLNGLKASWDLAVPSGTYSVRLVAGDPSFINSVYEIAAEGALIISGTPSSATHWFDNTITVPVTDGTLTLTNAAGSNNNKVDFIIVNKL